MCFLPDHEIAALGSDLIQPFRPENVEPSSIDCRLSNELLVPDLDRCGHIDLASPPPDFMDHVTIDEEDGYVLRPGQFVLGVTEETVTLPDNIVGKIEGKSSVGRFALIVHVTAGFIDPGFKGQVTLEMVNLLGVPIILRPGKKICQIAFAWMHAPAKHPYQGRYQNSRGAVASRYGG